jgi:hypothetical protein
MTTASAVGGNVSAVGMKTLPIVHLSLPVMTFSAVLGISMFDFHAALKLKPIPRGSSGSITNCWTPVM